MVRRPRSQRTQNQQAVDEDAAGQNILATVERTEHGKRMQAARAASDPTFTPPGSAPGAVGIAALVPTPSADLLDAVRTSAAPGRLIPETTVVAVRGLADALNETVTAPCLSVEGGCLRAQEALGPRTPNARMSGVKRRPFREYQPESMCATCAAQWYVEMAALRLETARRTGSPHGL